MRDEDETLGPLAEVVVAARDAAARRMGWDVEPSGPRTAVALGRVVPVAMDPQESPSRRFPST
ncbi:MAG: hypothetical protein WBG89_12900 [Ornithinimicrobium sp.]